MANGTIPPLLAEAGALGHRVDGHAGIRSPGAFVVVVATTTKECRRCGNDDKSRGQPIPQQSPSHRLPQEPRTTPDPDGHGWTQP
jgi:hypothetical protein